MSRREKKEGRYRKREQVDTQQRKQRKKIKKRKRKKETDKESNISRGIISRIGLYMGFLLSFSSQKSLFPTFLNLNFCLVMQIGSGFMGSS